MTTYDPTMERSCPVPLTCGGDHRLGPRWSLLRQRREGEQGEQAAERARDTAGGTHAIDWSFDRDRISVGRSNRHPACRSFELERSDVAEFHSIIVRQRPWSRELTEAPATGTCLQ